jgi:hypothetical protein
MAFTVEENNYNGMTSIQLRLKDLKFDWQKNDFAFRKFSKEIQEAHGGE